MPANTQVIFRPVFCVNSVMARFQLFVMFIVFRTCRGALQCKHDACGGSTRYTEPHESKTPSVIEEIPYMISPEDFYYKFVAKHRPLLLRRMATYWPANKVRWTILFVLPWFATHFALFIPKNCYEPCGYLFLFKKRLFKWQEIMANSFMGEGDGGGGRQNPS